MLWAKISDSSLVNMLRSQITITGTGIIIIVFFDNRT